MLIEAWAPCSGAPGRGGLLSLKSTPAGSCAVGSENKEASPKVAPMLDQLGTDAGH